MIDSVNGTLSLLVLKRTRLLDSLNKFIKRDTCKIVEFAKLLELVAACPTVKYGWLYTKIMESNKLLALQTYENDYTKRISKSDMIWWIANIPKSSNTFRQELYIMVISTDASDTGWGANKGSSMIFGPWNRF